jgi:hypothetical protein
MVSRAVYHKYRRLIEALGLRQLDVYRIRDNSTGKLKDIVRVSDPSTGKVVVVDLGTVRESLSYQEFLSKVLDGVKNAGIPLPDRLVANVMSEAKRLDEQAGRSS